MVVYTRELHANGCLLLEYKYHDDLDSDVPSLLPPQSTQDTVRRLGLEAPRRYAGSYTQAFTILSKDTYAQGILESTAISTKCERRGELQQTR